MYLVLGLPLLLRSPQPDCVVRLLRALLEPWLPLSCRELVLVHIVRHLVGWRPWWWLETHVQNGCRLNVMWLDSSPGIYGLLVVPVLH